MFDWAKEQFETVLGKTVTGLIGVFILGVVAMWGLPKWVVTTDTFAQEVTNIYKEMDKGDKWQELKIIELRKDIWTRRKWDLEDKIDSQSQPPTIRQGNRLEEIKIKINKLNEDEDNIREALMK